MKTILIILGLLCAFAAGAFVGMCYSRGGGDLSSVKFETEYQAVLLNGGQVYFGKLEGFGTATPVLKDVFYVQSVTNPETKTITSVLIQRGKEWHAPDRMWLNPGHIVLVEPVGRDSQVAKLIAEKKTQQLKP